MTPGIRKTQTRAPAAGTADGDIVEVLRADYAQLTALFDRFLAVAKSDNLAAVRDRLAHYICDALSIRRLAEEEVLYPEVRKESDKLVFALMLADQGISMRIVEIDDPEASSFERDLAVLRLIGMVRRHTAEREQVLLPLLRSRLSDARSRSLGAALAQRKLLHTIGLSARDHEAPFHAAGASSDAVSLLPSRARSGRSSAALN